jgi:hypothetical protein
VLSVIRQTTGAFTWGFILLALSGLICLVVLRAASPPRSAGALPSR